LNYVNEQKITDQNSENLEDSNGRHMGFRIYDFYEQFVAQNINLRSKKTMQSALANTHKMHSTRAMAFYIKGIYYANKRKCVLKSTDKTIG
jgi:hypothetical protein